MEGLTSQASCQPGGRGQTHRRCLSGSDMGFRDSASVSPTSLSSPYSDTKSECSSWVLECGGSRLECAHDKVGLAAHACNAGTLQRRSQTAQKPKVTLSYIRVSGRLGL